MILNAEIRIFRKKFWKLRPIKILTQKIGSMIFLLTDPPQVRVCRLRP